MRTKRSLSRKRRTSQMLTEAFNGVDEELIELSDRIKFLSENKMFSRNDRQNLKISSNYISAAIRVINDVFESKQEEWNDNKN